MEKSMEKLMNITEAAGILGVNNDTMRRKVREGEIPGVYLNSRAIRIRKKDLEKYITDKRRGRK